MKFRSEKLKSCKDCRYYFVSHTGREICEYDYDIFGSTWGCSHSRLEKDFCGRRARYFQPIPPKPKPTLRQKIWKVLTIEVFN
jgi:hypothetical protein